MPAYLVTVPDLGGQTLLGGSNRAVVFAADATDALAIAKTNSASDMDSAWGSATATEIVAGSDFTGYTLHCAVLDASPVIEVTAPATGIAVQTVAIDTAGTGYVAGEIVTLIGGTFTRAGTVRIVTAGGGIPSVIEVVDPGEYTVVPTASANAVTGGSGTGLLVDNTAAANTYSSMLSAVVGLLNADAQIANSAIDMGDGSAPLLTIASIADGLGDLQVLLECLVNGVAIPSLVGAVVDEGIAAAVLTGTMNVAPVVGNVLETLKS